MPDHMPGGYSALSPSPMLADPGAEVAFAVQALDAPLLRAFRNDAGRVLHAAMRVVGTVVMMGRGARGEAAHLPLSIPDPDVAVDACRAAGATLEEAVRARADGDTRGGVRAPVGTLRWVGRTGG